MQNHELVTETIVEKDGALTAVYAVHLKGGGSVESRQPLQARDANLQAVAKKRGVADITKQMAARGVPWSEAVAPQPVQPPKDEAPRISESPARGALGVFGGRKGGTI